MFRAIGTTVSSTEPGTCTLTSRFIVGVPSGVIPNGRSLPSGPCILIVTRWIRSSPACTVRNTPIEILGWVAGKPGVWSRFQPAPSMESLPPVDSTASARNARTCIPNIMPSVNTKPPPSALNALSWDLRHDAPPIGSRLSIAAVPQPFLDGDLGPMNDSIRRVVR